MATLRLATSNSTAYFADERDGDVLLYGAQGNESQRILLGNTSNAAPVLTLEGATATVAGTMNAVETRSPWVYSQEINIGQADPRLTEFSLTKVPVPTDWMTMMEELRDRIEVLESVPLSQAFLWGQYAGFLTGNGSLSFSPTGDVSRTVDVVIFGEGGYVTSASPAAYVNFINGFRVSVDVSSASISNNWSPLFTIFLSSPDQPELSVFAGFNDYSKINAGIEWDWMDSLSQYQLLGGEPSTAHSFNGQWTFEFRVGTDDRVNTMIKRNGVTLVNALVPTTSARANVLRTAQWSIASVNVNYYSPAYMSQALWRSSPIMISNLS